MSARFAPLLPSSHLDAAGERIHFKPSTLIEQGGGFVFTASKYSRLNYHRTNAIARAALAGAYTRHTGRPAKAAHGEMVRELIQEGREGYAVAAEHDFANSAHNLAALQATHGFQRFVVVFHRPPSPSDAARYIKAKLVFCTRDTLPDLLHTIELLRHGIIVPFVFTAKTYSFTVMPEAGSNALSAADVQFIDRSRLPRH